MNTLKTTIAAALALTALAGPAAAQQRGTDGMASLVSNDNQQFSTKMRNQPDVLATTEKTTASKGRPSLGPDLFGMVLAPVGIIVAPINAGLKWADEAVAPVNTLLLPITGPIRLGGETPAPVQPVQPVQPVADATSPEAVKAVPKPHVQRKPKEDRAKDEKAKGAGKPKTDDKPPA